MSSSSLGLHYIEGVRLADVRMHAGNHTFYTRTMTVQRKHPGPCVDQCLADVAEVTLYSDEPQKLITENEKQLIAAIKGVLTALESSSLMSVSDRLQELRQVVERVESGKK